MKKLKTEVANVNDSSFYINVVQSKMPHRKWKAKYLNKTAKYLLFSAMDGHISFF